MQFKNMIDESSKERGSNIILALDLPRVKTRQSLLSRAIKILDETQAYICAVKLNRQLILPLGLFDGVQEILSLAKAYELPTIMDCKINDVGHTNRAIAEQYFSAGFDAITANPFIGWKEGLEPVFETAHKLGKGVILLVYMSHEGAEEGYGQTVKHPEMERLVPQYIIFAEKALRWNADGVVVGATRPEKIREVASVLGDKVPVYSPGVGAQGGSVKRALEAGARYLIVGRSITLADNPSKSAKRIRKIAASFLR